MSAVVSYPRLSRMNFRCGRARYLLARETGFFVFVGLALRGAAVRPPFDLLAAARGALFLWTRVNRVWSAIVW
jgi:hypothetical protein